MKEMEKLECKMASALVVAVVGIIICSLSLIVCFIELFMGAMFGPSWLIMIGGFIVFGIGMAMMPSPTQIFVATHKQALMDIQQRERLDRIKLIGTQEEQGEH